VILGFERRQLQHMGKQALILLKGDFSKGFKHFFCIARGFVRFEG